MSDFQWRVNNIAMCCHPIRNGSDDDIQLPVCFPVNALYKGWEDQVVQALSESPCVRRLTMNIYAKEMFNFNRLLPYLRTTRNLRCLKINGVSTMYETINRPILKAINGVHHIDEIHLKDVTKPLDAVLTSLSKNRVLTFEASLSSFMPQRMRDIGKPSFFRSKQAAADALGGALKKNPNLQALTLILDQDDDEWESILKHLDNHPTLTSLSFCARNDSKSSGPRRGNNTTTSKLLPMALAPLVASTTTLQQLSLRSCPFGKKTARVLIEALTANRSIVHLSLHNCLFTKEALDLWLEFVQSSSFRANITRKLSVSYRILPDSLVPRVEQINFLVSLSQAPSLDMLSLADSIQPGEIKTILKSMGDNSRTNRLSRLHLSGIRDVEATGLAECLVKAVYLAELTMFDISQLDSAPLLAALKQNDSLTSVSLLKPGNSFSETRKPYFEQNSSEAKQIEVYCQRNAAMPGFLAKFKVGESADQAGLLVVPDAFFGVQLAPETGPNNILKTMLALDEDVVGSNGADGKRAAASN